MTKEQKIDENNELIANFLKLRKNGIYYGIHDENEVMQMQNIGERSTKSICDDETFDIYYAFLPSEMKFHSSFDWQMMVVEYIETFSFNDYIGFTVVIKRKHISIIAYVPNCQDLIIYQTPYGKTPESKKIAIFEMIIEFINWYNKEIKNSL